MLAARALSSLSEDAVSHAPLAASALVPLIELVGKGGAAGKVAMVTLNRMAAGGETEVLALILTLSRALTRTLTLTQVLDALARSPAAIGAYVHELKGSREEQVATMTALKHLAGVPMARQSIVDADGLGGLVEVAKSKSMDQGAKDAAALVLAALAAPPHTEQVAASGGVAALISVVAGTSQPELTLSAACALEYLVTTEAARAALLRGGVAPVLELLLHNKVEQVQLHALRVMQALADDEEGQQAINAAGAAFWLSRLAYSGDAGIREAVSGTLCSLATQASNLNLNPDPDPDPTHTHTYTYTYTLTHTLTHTLTPTLTHTLTPVITRDAGGVRPLPYRDHHVACNPRVQPVSLCIPGLRGAFARGGGCAHADRGDAARWLAWHAGARGRGAGKAHRGGRRRRARGGRRGGSAAARHVPALGPPAGASSGDARAAQSRGELQHAAGD